MVRKSIYRKIFHSYLKNKFSTKWLSTNWLYLKQVKGTVLVYETSKSGHRFKESKLQFSKTAVTGDHIELTVNRDQRLQKMLGVGAAFTDAAAINIDSLPKGLAESVVRDYFSGTGIEFTVGRVTIASSDFSPRWYSYDDADHEDYDLKEWKLQEEDTKHKVRVRLWSIKEV